MRRRDRLGLAVGPVFLRLALGVVFIWAGLGKIAARMPVSGQDAAILANLGVLKPAHPPGSGAGEAPGHTPPASPEPAVPGEPGGVPAPDRPLPDEAPASPPASPPDAGPSGGLDGGTIDRARILLVTQAGAAYTPEDFPAGAPISVRRVHGITLMLARAGNPVPADPGGHVRRLIPARFGSGAWPETLAWAAAVTELAGGVLALAGLFTRVAALLLAWTMVVAAWLTQIGPAIQSGTAVLGFLPAHPAYDPAWTTPLFQLTLLCAGLALALLGPGGASLDRVVFRPRAHAADDDANKA